MTLSEAKNDLLGLIGLETDAFASAPIKARILSDVNAALQQLWTMAPPWWSNYITGAFVNAPVSVSGLTLAKGGFTIVSSGPGSFPTWSNGCTVRLGDDVSDNAIVSRDASSNTVTLSRPYAGSNMASGVALIFHDSIALAADVISVSSPIMVVGKHELLPLNVFPNLITPQDQRCPENYFIDHDLSSGLTGLRIKLYPLPDSEYSLQFSVNKAAPNFTNLVSQGSQNIPVPQNYIDSIFLPLLRYQFSTWKHFEANAIRPTLKEQYQNAFQILRRLNPQPMRIGRVRILQ